MNDSVARHRSIRLKEYDYAQAGAYFVTVTANRRGCLFGTVVDSDIRVSPLGEIVQQTWDDLPNHYPHVALDAFIIMPNHMHGIIYLLGDMTTFEPGLAAGEASRAGLKPAPTWSGPAPGRASVSSGDDPDNPTERPTTETTVGAGLQPALPPGPAATPGSPETRHGLPEIVRAFKTFSARRINMVRGTPGTPVWQRGYYEHIIRNDRALDRIRRYIIDNPSRWPFDGENPAALITANSGIDREPWQV